MKRLLKIKFSVGKKLPVLVRAVRLPSQPGQPAGKTALIILPDGRVVRVPEPFPVWANNQPWRGSAWAALPPWQPRPKRRFRTRRLRHGD